MKQLLENFFSLVILQGANYLLPLITFPYLVRVLGIETYGIIIYALVIAQYFVILSAYGFNLYAPREIALNRSNIHKINEIFSSVYIIKISLSIIGFLLTLLLVNYIPKLAKNSSVILLTYGIVIGQALLPVWFFQGIERMKFITLINLLSRIIYAASIFIFVRTESDFLLVPIFNSIGMITAGLLGLFISIKQYSISLFFPKFSILLEHLRKSFAFFLSRISVSLYTISNTFILGTFGSMELVGIYAVAEKLFNALQGIYHPLVNTLYPFITKERNVKLFKKTFFSAIIINLFLIISLYIYAEYIFKFLFLEYNDLSLTIFKLLLFATIIIVPSILLGYPFLAALGHPKYTNFSVMLSSIVHISILTILVLTKNIYLHFVVYSLILTELLVFLIRLYGTFKFDLWRIKSV